MEFLVALGLCVVLAQPDPTPSFDEVVSILEDMEAASEAYSVNVKFRRGENAVKGGHVLEFESVHLEDSAGRARIDRSELRTLVFDGDEEEGNIDIQAVFDGTNMSKMSGAGGNYTQGMVSPAKADLPWGESPREFLTHYFNIPCSDLLKRLPGEVVGKSDGLLIVETGVNLVERDQTRRKGRLKLDEDFAIVERAQLIQYGDSDVWHLAHRIQSLGFFETETGMMVPTRGVVEHYDTAAVARGESDAVALNIRDEFQFSDWDLQPVFDDSTFVIHFPHGIQVNDKVQGKTFIVTDPITDSQLSEHLDSARAAEGEHNSAARTRIWLFWGNVVLIVFLAFFWYRKSRSVA